MSYYRFPTCNPEEGSRMTREASNQVVKPLHYMTSHDMDRASLQLLFTEYNSTCNHANHQFFHQKNLA